MKQKKPLITKREAKVAGVTFALFMTEALLHYNMGKAKQVETGTGFIPRGTTLLHMGMIVGTFSVLNGYILREK